MRAKIVAVAVALACGAGLPAAYATNGYFAHGWGTKSKAMAGVAAALPQDTLVTGTNPAGMAHVGTSLDLGVAFFNPSDRGYKANDDFSRNEMGFPTSGFVTPGKYTSDNDWFLVPSFGYNRILNDQMTIGISVFGNGGMNTRYRDRPVWENFAPAPNQLAVPPGTPTTPPIIAAPNGALFDVSTGMPVPVTNPDVPPPPNGNNVNPGGVYTATVDTGINLEQLFIEIPFTYKINDRHAVGIAPVFAMQSFEAKGLEPFRQMSVDPDNVTNNGKDWSYGFGVHLGWIGQMYDRLSLGVAYRTKVWMDEFDDYSGLFAEGGDFDIPAMLTLGVAFQARPDVVIALDYQRIFYGDVDSVSNSNNTAGIISECLFSPVKGDLCLGGDKGLGFGWDDVDVFKLGVAWDANEKWTVRGGVSYASDFAPGGEGLFNVIAPATVKWHFTLGATYRHSKNDEFNISLAYMPEEELKGTNENLTGSQTGSIFMEQKDIEISWTHRF